MDIDNTLALHGQTGPDQQAKETLERIRAAGLSCVVVSNAFSTRLKEYCRRLDVPYVPHARKPSPKSVYRACAVAGVSPGRAVMIGDQLFTDIAAARNAGCAAIRVDPLSKREPWFIRAKRLLERPIRKRLNLDQHFLDLPPARDEPGLTAEERN